MFIQQKMLSSSKLPQCPICRQVMDDPRQLPCGHSYCGPPKKCLLILNSNDRLLCAMCKIEHKMVIHSLKPMYGIREVLKELKQTAEAVTSKKTSSDGFYCLDHPKFPITLWCKTCQETMCGNCVDCDKHLDHQFVSFNQNLKKILQEQVAKRTYERENHMRAVESEIMKMKLRIKHYDQDLKNLEELECDKKLNNKKWNELQNFLSEKQSKKAKNMPENELIEWFFRGNFKTNKMIEQRVFADASTSTENTSGLSFQAKTDVTSSPTMRQFDPEHIVWKRTSLMYDDHFLNSSAIKINPVVVCFPYAPYQSEPMRSSAIVTGFCMFCISISRNLNKLHVEIVFWGSNKETNFTVEFAKPHNESYWIWRNKELKDYTHKRTTEVSWHELKVLDSEGRSIIRASISFHDLKSG